jgi:hypothetical protein
LPAVVGFVLVARGLFAGEAPVMRDFLLFEIPLKAVIAQALKEPHLPEWWLWDGMGVPLCASPNASIFHPSTLLLLLPFRIGFVMQLFWTAAIGGWGTYCLSRRLGTRRGFCAVAVAAWVLNGWSLSLMEETAFGLGASALPWAWWAALGLRRARRYSGLVLVLAVASTALAGDVISLYASALPAPLLAWNRRAGWRSLVPPAAALLLSGLVASVQLLPARALLAESPRRLGLGLTGDDYWNLGWRHFVKLVEPSSPTDSAKQIYFSSIYVGIPLLALACLALIKMVPRWKTWAGIAGLSLALAVGAPLPVWTLMAAVAPAWRGLQYPVKAIGPCIALVCAFAGLGAQRLSRYLERRPRVVLPGALVLAAASAAIAPFSGIALSASAGMLAVARRLRVSTFVGPLVAGFLSADLVLVHWTLLPTEPWTAMGGTPIGRILRDGGVGPAGFYFGETWQETAKTDLSAVELAEMRRHALYPLTNVLESAPTSNAYLPAFSLRYYELVVTHQLEWLSRLAGVFATRYFVVQPSQLRPEQTDRVRLVDPENNAAAYELQQVLPRAYVSWGVTVLPAAKVVPYLLGPSFRPGREVVLSLDGPFSAQATLARRSDEPAAPVDSCNRQGDEVQVTVTLEKPGMLVLNESIFEGVRATDNGAPTPVFAANHLVRGVALEAGRHQVRFTYKTPGLRLGAALSALGLTLLLVWERSRVASRK